MFSYYMIGGLAMAFLVGRLEAWGIRLGDAGTMMAVFATVIVPPSIAIWQAVTLASRKAKAWRRVAAAWPKWQVQIRPWPEAGLDQSVCVPLEGWGGADSKARLIGASEPGAASGTEGIGDPAFDRVVAIEGDRALSLTALDPVAREQLRDLVETCGARVEKGWLVVPLERTERSNRAKRIRPQLQKIVALAERMALPLDPEGRALALRDRALSEPVEAVALRCTRALRAGFPESEAARGLAGVLQARIADETETPEARGRAAALLVEALRPAEQVDALEGLLTGRLLPVRAAVLRALAGLGRVPDAATLAPALVDAPEQIAMAAAAVMLCAEGPDPELERLILPLLRGEQPQLVAVANALAVVGTAASVAPLRAVTAAGVAPSAQVAAAAVGRVQSRLSDAAAGQLTLAAPDSLEGAVSLPDASGDLTLVPADD